MSSGEKDWRLGSRREAHPEPMQPRSLRTHAVALALATLTLTTGAMTLGPCQDERVEELRRLVDDGYYREAERAGRELLEELRENGEDETLAGAEARQLLANTLRRIGSPQAEETLHLAQSAVDLKRQWLGEDDPSYAVALHQLATLHLMRNEARQALDLFEEALAIQERHGPPAELGLTLVRIGNHWHWTGNDFEAAESYYREAQEALEVVPDGRLNDSWRLEGDAMLASSRGDYLGSLRLYQEALALRETVLRPEHPLLAQSLEKVGSAFTLVGDYPEAREHLERAHRIAEEAYGPGHRWTRSTLLRLADLNDQLGAPARAALLYERALELAGKDDAGEEATCLLLYARHLVKEGRGSAGFELYRRFFDLCREGGSPARMLLADGLIYFGGSMERAGELESAAEALREAREILGGRGEGTTWIRLLNNEASLHLARALDSGGSDRERREQEAAEACEHAGRAVELLEKAAGGEHLELLLPLLNHSLALLLLGDTERAFATAMRAEGLARRNMLENFEGLESPLARRYAGQVRDAFQLVLSIVLQEGRSESERVDGAFDAAIRRRALVLDEMMTRARIARLARDPAVEHLRKELHRASGRLANLVLHESERPQPTYLARLERAREDRDRLEQSLAEKSRARRAQLERQRIGLQEVRAHLPVGSALVSYLSIEEFGPAGALPVYVAFVLRAGTHSARIVRLGGGREVEEGVGRWRSSLLRIDEQGEMDLREAGRRLREMIWNPVLACIGEAREVFVVPDGALHALSFAALPTDDDRYLIDTTPAVHYLTTERELVPPDPPFEPGRGLLVVAAPAPDSGPGQGRVRVLANAAEEAHEVAQQWTARPGVAEGVERLVGPEATEAAFERFAVGKRALHVASHGFLARRGTPDVLVATRGIGALGRREKDQPGEVARAVSLDLDWTPLVEQGLLLARPAGGATEGEGDGFLSAEELACLDLGGVECVVLAACSTGEGVVDPGEGVFGLQRALRLAGVRNTVTSLWPVEDAATREWMRAFYAAYLERPTSVATAVERAARAVLERRRAEGMNTHPFFWAAFVASGCEGRTVEELEEDE